MNEPGHAADVLESDALVDRVIVGRGLKNTDYRKVTSERGRLGKKRGDDVEPDAVAFGIRVVTALHRKSARKR